MGGYMEVIIHKEFVSLEKLLPKWNLLKEKYYEITIFQDMSWIKSWWYCKSRQKNISPYIIEIKNNKETIGVLPLYMELMRFARLHFRILKPIGSEVSDYLIPILSKEYPPEEILSSAFKKIYEDKLNWDYINWGDIPEDSFFSKFLTKQMINKHRLIEKKKADTCPFLKISNKVEEVKCKLDEDLLKKILSKERKLNKRGNLTFTLVTKEEEIEPVMNKFFELHIERWGRTVTPSKFLQEEEREHSMLAAKNLFQSGLLFLAYLSYNDEIIAIEFGMSDAKKIYLYLPAFNIKYRNYSVGNLLNYFIILEACKRGYDIVDFLRGDEKHKQEWGTVKKYNVKYEIYNHSLKSMVFKYITRANKSKSFNYIIHKLSNLSRMMSKRPHFQ